MLVEAVRFELTDPFESSVFKTDALSRALPRFLVVGSCTGIEPVLTESQSVVLTVTLTTPLTGTRTIRVLAEGNGIEPLIAESKSAVIPFN